MTSNTGKYVTLKYNEVEIENITFSELKLNEQKTQQTAWINYNDSQRGSNKSLLFQLPKIFMETGGIPNGPWVKEDKDRMKVTFPLNSAFEDSKQLFETLQAWDEHFSSDKVREQLFGKNASKYKYSSFVRIPLEDDDEVVADGKKKYPKFPSVTGKIDITFPDYKIKTKLFRTNKDDDGKVVRTLVQDVQDINSFAKQLPWKCNARALIRFSKLWAQPVKKSDPMYGIQLKIDRIEVDSDGASSFDTNHEPDFIDSDDEKITPVKTVQAKAPVKQVAQQVVQQVVQVDSDSDEDIKPVSKSVKKVESSEDEESDEEDIKPVKKTSAKVAPKPVVKSTSKKSTA